jgi:hypothetical protein
MHNQLRKPAIVALGLSIAIIFTPSPMSGMEFKFGEEGFTLNGQSFQDLSSTKGLVKGMLPAVCAITTEVVLDRYIPDNTPYTRFTIYKKNKDIRPHIAALTTATFRTIGTIAVDALYGDTTKKSIFTNIAFGTGYVAGSCIATTGHLQAINPGEFCGDLAAAGTSALYGDLEKAGLYVGKGAGTELGIRLFREIGYSSPKTMGTVVGSDIGIALAAHMRNNAKQRNYYLKKAFVDTAGIMAIDKSIKLENRSISPNKEALAKAFTTVWLSDFLITKTPLKNI